MFFALTALKNLVARASVVLLLGLSALPAFADVWGYIDARGMAHLSTEKLDERYELFFKGGESFSTEKLSPPVPVPSQVPADSAYAPTKLLVFFDTSSNYKAVKHLLKDASLATAIDYELLQAVIATESGFDSFAVSAKGAVGLMQLMPPTAQRYGVTADKQSSIQKKLTDPKTNITAGSRYLRDLIKMFPGQLELAVAAYNAGEGAVQRAGNKIPNYPETKNYVKTVMQLYAYLKPPPVVLQARPAPSRVRMEMIGGLAVLGRSNMVPALVAPPPALPSVALD